MSRLVPAGVLSVVLSRLDPATCPHARRLAHVSCHPNVGVALPPRYNALRVESQCIADCGPQLVTLERYGLKMHVGTVAKSSKTEYMVIPPRRNDAIDAADLAPVKTDDRGRRRDLNGLLQVPRRGR